MRWDGGRQLSLYPEDRSCPAPTAARILDIFASLARHHLLDHHGRLVQGFAPSSTNYSSSCSTCSKSRTASTPAEQPMGAKPGPRSAVLPLHRHAHPRAHRTPNPASNKSKGIKQLSLYPEDRSCPASEFCAGGR
jgi:hypothetical protein